MKKIILLIVLSLPLVWIIGGCLIQTCQVNTVQIKEDSLPPVEMAPWHVTTDNREFYAGGIELVGTDIKISNYYAWKDGKWVLFESSLVLNRDDWGEVKYKSRR